MSDARTDLTRLAAEIVDLKTHLAGPAKPASGSTRGHSHSDPMPALDLPTCPPGSKDPLCDSLR